MVYDSFQFFNELDILSLRMHILDPVVDRFVISESTVTFSGEPKPLTFAENRERFREFAHKIIHVVVDDTPMDTDAYGRDHHQKCAVARGLAQCAPDDIVLFSDVDEIPDPDMLRQLLPNVEHGKIYMPAQRLFYCYLNLEDVSGTRLSVTGEFPDADPKMWLGTKVCRASLLKEYTTEELRNKEQQAIGVRIPNGGWHFSYMGGTEKMTAQERVRYKLKSAAHQEYATRRALFEAERYLRRGEDIFGSGTKMAVREIDETYPAYLREHLEEYRYLLYKKPGFFRRALDDLELAALEMRRKLKGLS